MNQFSIILLKKALFSSLSKYFLVFISLFEDYAIGTIKHLERQHTNNTKQKLIINKIIGVPITILLSTALNSRRLYREYSFALFWFLSFDLACVCAKTIKSFAVLENFYASKVTPFLTGGTWACMVSSISCKSGQSPISFVSSVSKSISDYNWTYWSSVPSKCCSRLAVDGSAIMYFSTSSWVLNLLI